MKRALIISTFLLAFSVSGCSTPQAAVPAPQAQPDDAARRDADRNRDTERDKDRDQREIKTVTQIGTGKHTPNAPTVNIPSPIPTAGSAVSITERSVTENRATDSNATNVVDSAAGTNFKPRRTNSANAISRARVLIRWYVSHRCSCAIQSSGPIPASISRFGC